MKMTVFGDVAPSGRSSTSLLHTRHRENLKFHLLQIMFYLRVAEFFMQPVEHEHSNREAEVMRRIHASTQLKKITNKGLLPFFVFHERRMWLESKGNYICL
jgi:hypothetical protein